MPDLDGEQTATTGEEANIDMDDDKPDDTNISNETEFQGMKIEIRSGIEVPTWLKLYEWGVESLTAEGAICMDKFPTISNRSRNHGSRLGKMDHRKVYTKTLVIFIRGGKDAMTVCFEKGTWNKRIDLDEQVPYNGLDADGFPCEPTEEEHKEYREQKYVRNKKDDNAHRYEFEGYMMSYKMNLLCQRMILYCVRCGITRREPKNKYNIDPEEKNRSLTEEAQNERRKEAQQRLMEQRVFTRQIIRGALGVNLILLFPARY